MLKRKGRHFGRNRVSAVGKLCLPGVFRAGRIYHRAFEKAALRGFRLGFRR